MTFLIHKHLKGPKALTTGDLLRDPSIRTNVISKQQLLSLRWLSQIEFYHLRDSKTAARRPTLLGAKIRSRSPPPATVVPCAKAGGCCRPRTILSKPARCSTSTLPRISQVIPLLKVVRLSLSPPAGGPRTYQRVPDSTDQRTYHSAPDSTDQRTHQSVPDSTDQRYFSLA